MKGLRKYISPFTPDQSGAVSVLFGYGGMLIIMDAGGCVGNVCGYDEPRWGKARSAIFSAGLRDLDAILGRDELLIRKVRQALRDMDANFVGLIGTPVPATIATDYRALKRLMERDYGLPVLPVETNGIELYDRGQERAYQWLFQEFLEAPSAMAEANTSPISGGSDISKTFVDGMESDEANSCPKSGAARETGQPKACMASEQPAESAEPPGDSFIGVLGATPLDCTAVDAGDEFRRLIPERYGCRAVVYGMGDSLADVRRAHLAVRNLVVSPSGLKTARMLQEDYGIPYDVGYPVSEEERKIFLSKLADDRGKKILVIHQQVFANEIRRWIQDAGIAAEVDVASWFRMYSEIKAENDFALAEENDLLRKVIENQYDVVIGDPLLRRALPGWNGIFRSIPHFPISGELHSSETTAAYWQKAGEQ